MLEAFWEFVIFKVPATRHLYKLFSLGPNCPGEEGMVRVGNEQDVRGVGFRAYLTSLGL